MTNYNEALNIITDALKQIEPEIISINLEDSTGFILAEDIYADVNLPSFDYSTMDGFAVKYQKDVIEWKITGEITAGNYLDIDVKEGEAVSIMTGGKIPHGADTVIQVEDVEIAAGNIKLINEKGYKKKANIRYAAEDMSKNELAVKKNTKLTPNIITLAAAFGKSRVSVYKPFRIGVLSTGDELLDIDQQPYDDKIRNTNIYTLTACIRNINMVPVPFGNFKDDKDMLKIKIREILESGIDMLITSGGVSVGKHDFLPELLESIGAKRILWKVNIKPGKPFLFSIYENGNKLIPIFSLPGNPVSCFVNFEVLVRPVLYNIINYSEQRIFPAVLTEKIDKKDGKRHFIVGDYNYDDFRKEFTVKKSGSRSSGDMVSLSRANCLIIFPEVEKILEIGEGVECIKI